MKIGIHAIPHPSKIRKSATIAKRKKRKRKGQLNRTRSQYRPSKRMTARRKHQRRAQSSRRLKRPKRHVWVKRYVSSTFDELNAIHALEQEKGSEPASPPTTVATETSSPRQPLERSTNTNSDFIHEPINEQPPKSVRQLGVNLFGFCYAEMGIGQALRLGAMACSEAGVPITLHNYPLLKTVRQQDYSLLGHMSTPPIYDVNLVYFNPDILAQAYDYFSRDTFSSKYTIGYWHWELPVAPPEFDAAFAYVDEIWVPSEFVRAGIAERSPIPVYTMPHGITTSPLSPYNRSSFGIPEHHTVFLTMFDTYSITERKNPAAAIQAFTSAFQQNENAHLVIKGLCPENGGESYHELERLVTSHPQITLLTEPLSRQETWALIACCDAYVSLHRSEGFGLCCAEAMMLGKPVIATNWSGNKEFMKENNSYLIPYTLTPITKNLGPYTAGQKWADPSIQEGARYMRIVHEHPKAAIELGVRAKADMERQFSLSTSGARMRQRLTELIQG